VLDQADLEFIFGLDMLRKHQVDFAEYQFTFLFQFSSTEDKWDWVIIFMVYPSSHSCGFFLQCSIDLKDNVLRVGGGEIAVPFLQGNNLHYFCCSKV